MTTLHLPASDCPGVATSALRCQVDILAIHTGVDPAQRGVQSPPLYTLTTSPPPHPASAHTPPPVVRISATSYGDRAGAQRTLLKTSQSVSLFQKNTKGLQQSAADDATGRQRSLCIYFKTVTLPHVPQQIRIPELMLGAVCAGRANSGSRSSARQSVPTALAS